VPYRTRAGLRRAASWVGGIVNHVSSVLSDALESATGSRGTLVPPKRLQFVGQGDFEQIGADFLRYFVELGDLKQEDSVLDVGCGVGRMAAPLTDFLSPRGSYDGFDIVPAGIRWCSKHIGRKYRNFRFQLADVHNQFYHPEGRCRASEYRFPYDDEAFDFVFAASIFTHMLPEDMGNYLSEIARVLRKGRRCLITYFLLNQQSRRLLDDGASTLEFGHGGDGYRTADETMPECLVAYDEASIRDACERRGLSIVDPIHYGSWCGRESSLSFQDIVIASKE